MDDKPIKSLDIKPAIGDDSSSSLIPRRKKSTKDSKTNGARKHGPEAMIFTSNKFVKTKRTASEAIGEDQQIPKRPKTNGTAGKDDDLIVVDDGADDGAILIEDD